MPPQYERVPASEAKKEQKKSPEKHVAISAVELFELTANLGGKLKNEAQTVSADNSKKGEESVKALGGGSAELAQLAKLEQPVKSEIEALARGMGLKIQEIVGLDKQNPKSKDQMAEKEKGFKGQVLRQIDMGITVFSYTPMGLAMRPAIRLVKEPAYREHVLKEAPALLPVLAKLIATEGASLTNPKDLMVLAKFLINDPKTPTKIKEWANKALDTKQGEALMAKAGAKVAKSLG